MRKPQSYSLHGNRIEAPCPWVKNIHFCHVRGSPDFLSWLEFYLEMWARILGGDPNQGQLDSERLCFNHLSWCQARLLAKDILRASSYQRWWALLPNMSGFDTGFCCASYDEFTSPETIRSGLSSWANFIQKTFNILREVYSSELILNTGSKRVSNMLIWYLD